MSQKVCLFDKLKNFRIALHGKLNLYFKTAIKRLHFEENTRHKGVCLTFRVPLCCVRSFIINLNIVEHED